MGAAGRWPSWWRALVRTAYRLLYGPLAATYDLTATVASGGQWWDWQRTTLPWVQGRRVLDLACGTGHLLADLGAAGHPACGLDRSPSMLRQARSRLARRGLPARLVLGDATRLPVRAGALTTVTMTFSGLSLDPRVLAEVRRALAPGGRLVVLDQVHLTAPDLPTRWSRIVLGLTNVAPEYPILERLREAGFSPEIYEAPVGGNRALVMVARPEAG